MIEVRGEGPTVVLAQGLGMAASSWRAVADDLAADHRVVTLDRPGLGAHPTPSSGPACLADDTDRLAEAVTAAGAPAVIVAHSMAAFAAEALARTRPDLVAALVLLDPSIEDDPRPTSWRDGVAASLAAGLRRIPRLPAQWPAVADELAAYLPQARELAALRREGAPVQVPVEVVTARRLLPLPGQDRWRAQHATLTERLRAGHPLGEEAVRSSVLVPSGHLVMIDRPAEVAALVRSVARRQRS